MPSSATVNPVAALAAQARAHGVPMLVDGAQAVAHLPAAELDVQALGVDFYVFSGHKIYAPTGIGALWGKLAHLERMPPWQGGGDIRLIAFTTDPGLIRKILTHLGEPLEPRCLLMLNRDVKNCRFPCSRSEKMPPSGCDKTFSCAACQAAHRHQLRPG